MKPVSPLRAAIFAALFALFGLMTERLFALQQSVDKLSAFIQLVSPADGGHPRLEVRRFMIRSKLAQVDRPIVIMGDSITEAALLPASVCGHPIINAGIGGMRASTYLTELRRIMTGQPIDLAVIALGTNDASVMPNSEPGFASNYEALSDFVAHDASKVVFVGLPPIETSGTLARYFDLAKADRINETIRTLAHNNEAGFVDLRAAMTAPNLTADGVHLNRAGYRLWSAAVLDGIKSALGCAAARSHQTYQRPTEVECKAAEGQAWGYAAGCPR